MNNNDETYHHVKAAKVALKNGNDAVLNTGGYSMFPFIKPNTKVHIRKCKITELKKGDLIAFETKQSCKLHRLVSIHKDFIVCQGDSCLRSDGPIPLNHILGKIVSVESKSKKISIAKHKTLLNLLMIHFGLFLRLINAISVKIIQRSHSLRKYWSRWVDGFTIISAEQKSHVKIGMLLSTLQGALPLLLLFFIKILIERLSSLTVDETVTMPWFELILVIGTFLIQALVQLFNNAHRERLSMRISQQMFKLLHTKHGKLPMAYLDDANWQNKIHQAAYEIRYRPMQMINHLLAFIQAGVGAILVVAMILYVRWWIIPIIAVALIPEFIVRFWHARRQYALKKNNLTIERKAMYYSRVLTGSTFAKELRLFGISDHFNRRFFDEQNKIDHQKRALLSKQFRFELLAQTFGIVLVFITFGMVVQLSIQGILSLGTVVFVFFLMQRGFTVLKSLSQTISQLFEDSVFVQDFLSFIHLPEKKTEQITKLSFAESIQLKDVSLQYNNSKREALKNISFSIRAGEKVAIIGHNGSGKTTLVKLMCGLYSPNMGTIQFDDTTIDEKNRHSVQDYVTTVFQDFALYNLTVTENIALGDIENPIDKNRVKASIKFAGLTEIIENLPGGYNCKLGNMFMDGEELSFGQWQRLAIARAHYRNRNLVIMDEPSSALDPQSEAEILNHLQELASEKTLIIVSHRLHAIQWVDRIIVMNEGQIESIGSHETLIRTSAVYQNLYNKKQD